MTSPVRDENKVKIKHGFNEELYIWTITAHRHCADRDMNEYSQFTQYINSSKTNQVSNNVVQIYTSTHKPMQIITLQCNPMERGHF